jgi:hypothetical protein
MTITAPPSRLRTAVRPATGPSTTGYWVGAAVLSLAVLGSALWAAVAFLAVQHGIDGWPRLTVPGATSFRLTGTSTRVGYYENDRDVSTPTRRALRLIVTGPAGPVPLTSSRRNMRYDVPGRSGRTGRPVAAFRPTRPGTYRVTSTPRATLGGQLAVGGDVVADLAPQAAGGIALFVLGGGAGGTVLVVTAVRRRKGRRPPGC